MPKKKFIDKKHAVTFNLVYRSQQDPLVADENAPQRVLVPEKNNKQIEEQQKYGIYYDDDYDYLQHLRDVGDAMEWKQSEDKQKKKGDKKLHLPSSVFASNVEEDVGLLNKAAPHSGLRLDVDFDVVAAMDDDFDYDNPDNVLEDNFVALAEAECSNEESENEFSSDFESEERDEVCSLEEPQHTFQNEETKSRFTEYSLSSSVIRRNEQLQLLDRRFEQFYTTHYDDSQIGALDGEEIEGYVPLNSDRVLQWAEDFEKERRRRTLDEVEGEKSVRVYSDSESDHEYIEVPQKPKYDCVSILSTMSNIYNHPKLITPEPKKIIKINKRSGMPVNVLYSNKLTPKTLAALNDENNGYAGSPKSECGKSVMSQLSMLSIRSKDENSEEKRERKRLLREYRKERRIEKKATKEAFKKDRKIQSKMAYNNKKNMVL